jgi:hypothetical protein
MTLGRTSDNKIKIKTDGGLRAVECACCVSPPPFVIGLVSVHFASAKTRCAISAYEAIMKSTSAYRGESFLVGNDNVPFECYESLLLANKSLCDVVTEIAISESPSSQRLCCFVQNDEEFITTERDFGFNYSYKNELANFTETTSSDIYSATTSTQNTCAETETRTPAADQTSALLGASGACESGFELGEVTYDCGTYTAPGNFEFGQITFLSHTGECNIENSESGYSQQSVTGPTTDLTFDTVENSEFAGEVQSTEPKFPNYPAINCLVEQVFYPPASTSSEFSAEVYISEFCDPVKKILTSCSRKKTKFKIVHNVSPTGYLKVWVKKGRLILGTQDFEYFTYETYIHSVDITTIPQSARACTIYYSNEWELTDDLDIQSFLDSMESGYIEQSGDVDYAYIVKYSFVEGYEPQTTGSGTNETSYENGFPTGGGGGGGGGGGIGPCPPGWPGGPFDPNC